MELAVTNQGTSAFNARGLCPHCAHISLHLMVAGPVLVSAPERSEIESNVLVQCQNCLGVSLVIAVRSLRNYDLTYSDCYPLDNPEKSVEKVIPAGVRDDYVEALRCDTVRAYKAAVVMCRRSLQASCRNLNAEGKNLINQIDDLAAKDTITAALKNMAHEIRKLGNEGAHPDEDGLGDVTEEDSDDIIEFTRQYFEHVYVMPARSEAYRQRREASVNAASKPATA